MKLGEFHVIGGGFKGRRGGLDIKRDNLTIRRGKKRSKSNGGDPTRKKD